MATSLEIRNRLINVIQDDLGFDVDYMMEQGKDLSTTALIVIALENIMDKLAKLEDHSHEVFSTSAPKM